jgi:hypothetical protein
MGHVGGKLFEVLKIFVSLDSYLSGVVKGSVVGVDKIDLK